MLFIVILFIFKVIN